MALYLAMGSASTVLSNDQLRDALYQTFDQLGPRQKVVAVPPDHSRYASRAGDLTCMAYDYYRSSLVDVIPAVGTHYELSDEHRQKMFPTVPKSLFRYHNWETDADPIGDVDADFVADVTEGIYREAWPVQLNRRLWREGHDLILSIGQVVPHEVIGMANYNKNLFVGTGGVRGINESHYIGAVYGMERTMGQGDTPLAAHPQQGAGRFLPTLASALRVDGDRSGRTRAFGSSRPLHRRRRRMFLRTVRTVTTSEHHLSGQPLQKAVVWLDPEKFPSTWLGNKAIYRTRMAMADRGELIVLAPGVSTFGEAVTIDKMIRKYGYRTTGRVQELVAENDDLHRRFQPPPT